MPTTRPKHIFANASAVKAFLRDRGCKEQVRVKRVNLSGAEYVFLVTLADIPPTVFVHSSYDYTTGIHDWSSNDNNVSARRLLHLDMLLDGTNANAR